MTKIDLEKAPDLSMYTEMEIPVFPVSNSNGKGLDALLSGLEGKLCVLVGHSGVGKSTIINALLKNEILPTANVGKKSGRGRHTTTNSSIHLIGKSTLLIDTPGIRSLELFDITADTLRFYFPEFDKFSAGCQYRDCTHSHEPNCAVKNAVERKELSKRRYESYIRLLSEQ
jgi:ribosome biogenesis GTPase